VKSQVEVFWVLTLFSSVVRYKCFGGLCCFDLQDDRSSKTLVP